MLIKHVVLEADSQKPCSETAWHLRDNAIKCAYYTYAVDFAECK